MALAAASLAVSTAPAAASFAFSMAPAAVSLALSMAWLAVFFTLSVALPAASLAFCAVFSPQAVSPRGSSATMETMAIVRKIVFLPPVAGDFLSPICLSPIVFASSGVPDG